MQHWYYCGNEGGVIKSLDNKCSMEVEGDDLLMTFIFSCKM
jgi:hypothetical protein